MVLQVKPLIMLKFLSSKAVVHLRYTPLQKKVFIKSHPIYLSLCCELPEPLCICHSDLLRGRVCHGWLWILKLLVTENHKCVQGADFKPLCSVCLQKVWVFNLFGIWLCLSPLLVDASRPRRLLQTHVLRDREPPLHGGHTKPGLRKQMCLLLEVKLWSFTLG